MNKTISKTEAKLVTSALNRLVPAYGELGTHGQAALPEAFREFCRLLDCSSDTLLNEIDEVDPALGGDLEILLGY